MNFNYPSDRPPARLTVPNEHSLKLRFTPGLEPINLGVTTYLPFPYKLDKVLDPKPTATKIKDMSARLATSAPVHVRRYYERLDRWGPWLQGKVFAQSTTFRPQGPFRTYYVDFVDELGSRREEFVPYLGEVWNPAESAPPDDKLWFYQRRKDMNYVLVPIATSIRYENEKTGVMVVMYIGQALYVEKDCTEWHIRVLEGPYEGHVMVSKRAYSFDMRNQRAVQSSDSERIYGFIKDVNGYYAVDLPGMPHWETGIGWS